MSFRVVYAVGSSSVFLDVASELAQTHGWEPCYWIALPSLEQACRERFPAAIFQSHYDAIRGIRPKDVTPTDLKPLDQKMLEEMALYECYIIKMMDRLGFESFSYQERVRHYHRELIYWTWVVDHFKPDLFVISDIPHEMYDYLLYAVCEKRGIKTLMLECLNHHVPGWLVAHKGVETTPQTIGDQFRKLLAEDRGEEVELEPQLEDYVKRASGAYDKFVDPGVWKTLKQFETNKVRHYANKLRQIRRYGDYARNIASRIKQFLHDPPGRYMKINGRKLEKSSKTVGLKFLAYQYKARRYKKALLDYYHGLCSEPDLSRPYIFVALHFQPERSTSPQGGFYTHQVMMVDLLSKLLPEGWLLYVKEHRYQFIPQHVGERGRMTDFYDDIAALPNVRLIHAMHPPFQLIDNARAIATVTGTAAWEGVLRGKPGLVFGDAWYAECEGMFRIRSKEDLESAYKLIVELYKPDQRKVRLFVKAAQQVAMGGFLYENPSAIGRIGYEENVEFIAKGLYEYSRSQ